jgi:acyl-CoA reductase-like NAD-dependent aldehyde dehydrogenase
MRLYVGPMDTVIVEVDDAGRVRLEEEPGWSEPTLQERRAIIYAARKEIEELSELIDRLDAGQT